MDEIEPEDLFAPAPVTIPTPQIGKESLLDGLNKQDQDFAGSLFSVDNEERAARATLLAAAQHNPDKYGKALGIANKTNLPADYIERNFESVVRDVDFDSIHFADMAKNSPALTQWLQKKQNAIIARDNLTPLEALEKSMGQVAKPEMGFFGLVAESGAQGFTDLNAIAHANAIAFGLSDNETFADIIVNKNKSSADLAARSPEFMKEYAALKEMRDNLARQGSSRIEEIDAALDQLLDTDPDDIDDETVREIAKAVPWYARPSGRTEDAEGVMTVDSMRQLMRSSGVPTKLARAGIEQGLAENRRVLESLTGDNRTQSDAEATQRDAMLLSWADMVSNPRGAAADTARQLPMSTPGLVTGGTAAGAGAAGGPVVATLAFASGVALGQVPVEFGAWVVGEVEKQAGDATDRDAVLAVLNDEEFMTRVMGEALRKGVSQAAVEGMFAMAGGKVVKAIGPAGQGAGLARRAAQRGGAFAVDSAAQMAGAGAGEAVGQFAATGEVDWMEVMRETQGELAGGMATTTAAIVSQQSFTGTAKGSKAVADMIEATRSVSANEALSRTVEAIKTDITAGRSPEAMLELLKTKSPEGEAYFQADKWNELWNAEGVNPAQAAADMLGGDLAQYSEALANGADIAVPVADLAMALSKIENASAFIEEARIQGMTPKEAKAVAKQIKVDLEAHRTEQDLYQAEIEAEVNDLARMAAEDDRLAAEGPLESDVEAEATLEAFSNSIRKQVEMELLRSGQKAIEARAQAMVMTAGMTTIAKRSGLPLETVRAMAPMVVGAARFDRTEALINRIREDRQPTQREMYGPSLADFLISRGGVVDHGGEMAHMEAGRARHGIMSSKGMPLDTAAEAALEAGYPVMDSNGNHSINKLLELLSDDLFGNLVFSPDNTEHGRIAMAQEMEQLASELDRMGIDVKNMTNAEVRREIDRLMVDTEGFSQVSPDQAAMADTIEVDGVDRPTLNSNGQRIAATEEAVANFWRWFGESKVVDEQGRPLVVYHGTPDARFIASTGVFSTAKQRLNDGYGDAPGNAEFFFTDSQSTARSYADDSRAFDFQNAENAVLKLYLKIENPENINALGKSWGQRGGPRGQGEQVAAAREAGNDGMVIKNTIDTYNVTGRERANVFVAFNRSAIKSAENAPVRVIHSGDELAGTGPNRGTFDPARDSILEQAGRSRSMYDALIDHLYSGDIEGTQIGKALAKVDFLGFADREDDAGNIDDAISAILSNPNWRKDFDLTSTEQGVISRAMIASAPESIRDEMRGLMLNTRYDPQAFDHEIMLETFTDSSAFFEQGGQGPSRGSFNPFTNIITMGRTADRSTFVHETGHFFLEMQGQIVRQLESLGELNEQQQGIVNDYNAVLNWLGVTREQWSMMGMEQRREMHEKYATAFEGYLMEGKAPSKELRNAFRRFKDWLTALYKTFKAIISPHGIEAYELNDEIRGLFDRLLATDEAIQEVADESVVMPVFEDSEELEALAAEARLIAGEELLAEQMKEISAEQEALKRAERKRIRKDIEEMVAEERVYRALAILQSKAGTELEGGGESFKINRDSLAEVADPESMRTLQRRKVYSVEGGLPVHVAARLLGYDNVTEFVADLIEAPGRKTRVDALIQEHIDLTFPAMMDTGEIRSVAIEKVQNAKGKLLEREIEILAERLGRPRSREAHAAARRLMAEKAREMIAGKQYRKVKPSEYLRAERRAAREAIEAAKNGDLATVERLKKRQQFNAYLYSAGMDARSAGRKHRTYLMRVSKKPTQVKLGKAGLDYQNRVNELIESVELAPRSEKWDQRKESLAKWLENPDNAATLDGPLLKSLQSQTETRSWDSLTVRQQQELRDAVQAIVKQATLKDLLLKNLRWRKEDDAAVAVVAELEENLPPVREVKDENLRTIIDKGLSWVTSFDTAHRMLSSWARDAGGGKLGAFFDAFVEPLGTADSNLLQMKQRMTEGFLNLTKQWEADGRSVNDRMGGNQNREGVLVMALNWGNLGNRDRLMKGHGMSEAQVQAYLDMMDATDLQFVQGVFDLIETMWPELAEVSRRLTGLVPGKVEAEPIIAAAGTIAGGYYPIVYDKQQSGKVMTRESADEVLSNLGKSMRATTAKGHREARQKEGTGAKLRMSLDVIPQHIDTVSIDIVYSEVIRDINTLLDDSRVSGAIDNHLGVGANAAIRQLIIDIVRPARSGTVVDKLTRGLRNGVSVAALGFRLATVLMQTAGVTNSMRYTGAGKFMAAAKRVASSPIESIKFITDASPMMAQRYEIGKVREAREAVEDLRGSSWRRKLTVAAYWAMTKVQFAMVDAPTWMAAYEARKLEGDSEARAVAVADQTVTDAQGGGRRMDLNEVQRSQWLNLFTVFGTFMFRQYNQLRETGGGIRRDGLTLKHVHDAALIFIMPAVLTTIIRLGIGMMRGDEDEKYDLENLPETFAKEFGIELASSAVSGIALAREIPGAIEYGYSGPAGTRGIGLISELLKRVGTGDFSERTVSTALQSAGIFFKLPTGQLDTMFKAVMDMMEEDEIRPQSLLLGPPKR